MFLHLLTVCLARVCPPLLNTEIVVFPLFQESHFWELTCLSEFGDWISKLLMPTFFTNLSLILPATRGPWLPRLSVVPVPLGISEVQSTCGNLKV